MEPRVKPSGFGHVEDVVRRDHGTCSRHVLGNHAGTALNVFPHMSREQPGPNIVPVAGLVTDSNGNRFALIIRSLRIPAFWEDCQH
jgi:hypothetical protein